MLTLENKNALVIGLEPSGISAARLLRERGAEVLLLDSRATLDLERVAEEIDLPGVPIKLGVKSLPLREFDFAVVAPEILLRDPLLLELKRKEIPVISELELGYQQSLCLNISVTGTNGKTRTAQIIEQVLAHAHRKTIFSDETSAPLTSLVGQTKELDFLTLEVSSFQLEHTKFFRPTIAVLLNLAAEARNFLAQQLFLRAAIAKRDSQPARP